MSMNSVFVGIKFGLGLLSVKVVSVLLGPSGMAITSQLRDFVSMFKSFSSLGINNVIIKSYKDFENDKGKLSQILSSFFWSYVILSVTVGVLIILFSRPINEFLFDNYEYHLIIKLIGLLLPLYFIHLFLKALLNSLELFKSIIKMQIISAICTFLLTFVLIYYKGLYGGILAIALLDIIILSITVFFIFKHKHLFNLKLHKVIKEQHLIVLKKYALMASLTSIIVPITMILIRNNIISSESEFKAGIWDSAKRISGFYMVFVSSGLTLYYVPKIAGIRTNALLKDELKKYYTTLMPVFLIGLILVFLFKDFIIQIALTDEFYEVKKIMIWQLIGDFIKVAALAFGYILSVRAMVYKYIAIELIFNISYLLLAKFLLVKYSIEGVVIGYMIANMLSLVFMLWFFRKLLFSKHV